MYMYFGQSFIPLVKKTWVEFLESRSQNSSSRDPDRDRDRPQADILYTYK